jgi:AraC-like DNA-binding protein
MTFAEQLSVHVNHLNRAIRETTGKTTTAHISERIANEAIALLRHTNWNISEISYSLGFEEPAHFNNFFKKQTSQTPRFLPHCLNFASICLNAAIAASRLSSNFVLLINQTNKWKIRKYGLLPALPKAWDLHWFKNYLQMASRLPLLPETLKI